MYKPINKALTYISTYIPYNQKFTVFCKLKKLPYVFYESYLTSSQIHPTNCPHM